MKLFSRIAFYVISIVLLAAGIGFWIKHDEVLDWAATRNYQPPAEIEQMAADTAMTPYAKRLFYANQPVVADKDEFNQRCVDPTELVAVLGCYLGNRMGIYIYNVTDERLHGIKQVTAAHEMLHQAYERLGADERQRIDALLEEYYEARADERLREKIAIYQRSGSKHLSNEMHSIFGTEAPDLPAELEKYYQRYFEDRRRVLELFQGYRAEFDERISQIEAYDEQLDSLRTRINDGRQELVERERELHTRRARLDADLAANRIDEYNSGVPGFNALVREYHSLINQINSMVDEHNRTLEARNALAVEERELEAAIDSRVDAAPSQ